MDVDSMWFPQSSIRRLLYWAAIVACILYMWYVLQNVCVWMRACVCVCVSVFACSLAVVVVVVWWASVGGGGGGGWFVGGGGGGPPPDKVGKSVRVWA